MCGNSICVHYVEIVYVYIICGIVGVYIMCGNSICVHYMWK